MHLLERGDTAPAKRAVLLGGELLLLPVLLEGDPAPVQLEEMRLDLVLPLRTFRDREGHVLGRAGLVLPPA